MNYLEDKTKRGKFYLLVNVYKFLIILMAENLVNCAQYQTKEL